METTGVEECEFTNDGDSFDERSHDLVTLAVKNVGRLEEKAANSSITWQ